MIKWRVIKAPDIDLWAPCVHIHISSLSLLHTHIKLSHIYNSLSNTHTPYTLHIHYTYTHTIHMLQYTHYTHTTHSTPIHIHCTHTIYTHTTHTLQPYYIHTLHTQTHSTNIYTLHTYTHTVHTTYTFFTAPSAFIHFSSISCHPWHQLDAHLFSLPLAGVLMALL